MLDALSNQTLVAIIIGGQLVLLAVLAAAWLVKNEDFNLAEAGRIDALSKVFDQDYELYVLQHNAPGLGKEAFTTIASSLHRGGASIDEISTLLDAETDAVVTILSAEGIISDDPLDEVEPGNSMLEHLNRYYNPPVDDIADVARAVGVLRDHDMLADEKPVNYNVTPINRSRSRFIRDTDDDVDAPIGFSLNEKAETVSYGPAEFFD